jgi:hypothetical protein
MRYVVPLSLLALFACGGSSSNTPTTNDTVAQLSIKSTGITTQTGVAVASGISVPTPGFVVFTNNDSVAHTVSNTAGNPSDCTPLTTIGTLQPNVASAQLTLTNTTSADVVCSFSAPTATSGLNAPGAGSPDATSPALTGSITILTTSTGTGSGY